jgi:hypothetical protein
MEANRFSCSQSVKSIFYFPQFLAAAMLRWPIPRQQFRAAAPKRLCCPSAEQEETRETNHPHPRAGLAIGNRLQRLLIM